MRFSFPAQILAIALATTALAQATAIEIKKELLPKIKKAQAEGKDLGVAGEEFKAGDEALKQGLQEEALEHPVVPVAHETRYPLSADGKLPRPYTELPDCFATLAAAAAVTRRLRLGTGICLVPERDPLLTAHQVSTLDWLSGGRFLFGIGAGWLKEEMDLFTPHFPYRFAFMREAVAAMRKLWTEDAPAFEGRWVRFPAAVCRPKPVQRPHPPVILGGMGPNAIARVAAWGDGRMPIALAPEDVAHAPRGIDRNAPGRG